MSITISATPEKLEDGRYLIPDTALWEIRKQVLRNDTKAALLSFAEGAAGYDGASAAETIANDEKLLDEFCKELDKYVTPWSECWTFADLVLSLDENLHDYSYAPAEENVIRDNVLDICSRFGLRFSTEDEEHAG